MNEFEHIDLDDYSDEQKREAIRDHLKMIRYQELNVLEQFMINLRNKGYSVGTLLILFAGGGLWQKDKIAMFFNPEITQSEITEANSSNELVLKEIKVLLGRHGGGISKVQKLLTDHIDSPKGH